MQNLPCPYCQCDLSSCDDDTINPIIELHCCKCDSGLSININLADKKILRYIVYFSYKNEGYYLVYQVGKIILNIREIAQLSYYKKIIEIKTNQIFYFDSLKEDSIKIFNRLIKLAIFN